VKRAIVLVLLIAAGFAGGVLWMKKRAAAPTPAAETSAKHAPSDEEAAAAKVSRDTNGNAVIAMSNEIQGGLGVLVKSVAAFQMSPEQKGYGRVLDPAPLVAVVTELASARAAYTASSSEVTRLKTLEGQGNASARALQTAEAAATRDYAAIESARERLILSWGKAVADQNELPAFIHDLSSLETALVRIDLLAGETLKEAPAGARVENLAGASGEAAFLERAPSVDPQMQGQGFLFLLKPNSLRLTAGESVVGYVKIPGEPLAGVIIPREAVVRTEGAGWVYVLGSAGDAFTRIEVALDNPTEAGWFVTKGLSVGQRVVVAGAQQLLAIELRGAGGEE
jgi:hypothetical protein